MELHQSGNGAAHGLELLTVFGTCICGQLVADCAASMRFRGGRAGASVRGLTQAYLQAVEDERVRRETRGIFLYRNLPFTTNTSHMHAQKNTYTYYIIGTHIYVHSFQI